jgi:hypothetical protein
MSNYYSNKCIKISSIFSSLHCFCNFPILRDYFKNNKIKKEKEVSKFFSDLIKSIHKNKNIFENIKNFKQKNLLLLYENDDESQEISPISFIHYIMSKLSEELNILKEKKKYIQPKNGIKSTKLTNYTDNYKNNISSVITENFLGVLELKTTCECGNKEYEFNYFYYLSFNLDFLIEQNISLYDNNIFNALLKNEIERKKFCKKCQEFTMQKELIKLFDVPKNLIIFFDRRKKNSNKKIKEYTDINFKETLILDDSKIELFSNYKKKMKYYLYAILCEMQDNDCNEIYLSFTLELKKGNENINDNNNNNSSTHYCFKDIKNSYNIIGLFYYSDEEKEKINDNMIGQNIYKINICKQNEKIINNNAFNDIANANNNNMNLNNINFNNNCNNNFNENIINNFNNIFNNNINNIINNNFNNNFNNIIDNNINNIINNNFNNNFNDNFNNNNMNNNFCNNANNNNIMNNNINNNMSMFNNYSNNNNNFINNNNINNNNNNNYNFNPINNINNKNTGNNQNDSNININNNNQFSKGNINLMNNNDYKNNLFGGGSINSNNNNNQFSNITFYLNNPNMMNNNIFS